MYRGTVVQKRDYFLSLLLPKQYYFDVGTFVCFLWRLID